jgi:hypothetical protein
MSGAVPYLTLYASMSWTETPLSFWSPPPPRYWQWQSRLCVELNCRICGEWCIGKDLEWSVRCQIESLFRHFLRRGKEKGRKTLVWRVFGPEFELIACGMQVGTVVDWADVLGPVFGLFLNLFLICYSPVNFHWTTNPAYALLYCACLERCYIRCTQFLYI